MDTLDYGNGDRVKYRCNNAAWGNILSTTGTMANTLGTINPLRYRGYVYDQETGLYYLQSRYYDPEIGRFINGDAFNSTGQGFIGNNMFAYCGNNPVIFRDSAGTRHEISAGGIGPRIVTEEIMLALHEESSQIVVFKPEVNYNPIAVYYFSKMELGMKLVQFYFTVRDLAPWDIKISGSWENTIGTEYPGKGCEVYFDHVPMTPEMLGNFTYGYLGNKYGFSLPVLYGGSYFAAEFPIKGENLNNELWDWTWITKGYKYAHNDSW